MIDFYAKEPENLKKYHFSFNQQLRKGV